jgi:hypothetical protein
MQPSDSKRMRFIDPSEALYPVNYDDEDTVERLERPPEVNPKKRGREVEENDHFEALVQKMEKVALEVVDGAATLDAKDSLNLYDAALIELTENLQFKKLTIPQARLLTNEGFIQAIWGRRDLEEIDFSACKQLGDWALGALGNHCPSLTKVSLVNCPLITDAGVSSLVSRCPELRSITLDGSYGITDESLVAIARRCMHLEEISLLRCNLVTDMGIHALQQHCRNLRVIER